MEIITVTQEEFEKQVLQAKQPILLDFWAPWCGYCRRIAPAIDQIAERYGEQVLVGKVNIDEQPALAQKYQVDTIPTLLVFQNGTFGEPLIAPDSMAQIVDWMKEQQIL